MVALGDQPFGACDENIKKQSCTGKGVGAKYCTSYVVKAQQKQDIATILAAKLSTFQLGPHNELLTEIEITGIKRKNRYCYEVDVCWKRREAVGGDSDIKTPGENVAFQFGIQTSTKKRASSYSTVCFGSNDDGFFTDVSPNGAPIGVIEEGRCKITGCDVISPNKTYCETHCIAAELVSKEYCRALSFAVGSVNAGFFRDCEPCEMLLTSVQFNRPNTRSDWTANFCWAIAPNLIETYDIFLGFAGDGDPLTPADNTDPEFETVSYPVSGWDHVQFGDHCYTDAFGTSQIVFEFVKIHRVYNKFQFQNVIPANNTLLRVSGSHPLALRNRNFALAV